MGCHQSLESAGESDIEPGWQERMPMDLRVRLGAEAGLRILPLWKRLQDQGLRRLLEHWSVVRGDAVVPSLAQIDPSRLGPVMPNLWLFSVAADGALRCRLHGPAASSAFSRMVGDRTVHEVLGDPYGDIVSERWRFVLRRPAIAHARSWADDAWPVEHLVLPVADARGRPMHVLGATVFDATRPGEPNCDALAAPTFYLLGG